jgi:MoaD family protein
VRFVGKVKVTFFGPLTETTRESDIEIEAFTIKDAISILAGKYGEHFKSRVCDERGRLRKFVNVYVNGRDIRFINHLDTILNEGDAVSIIPAVGGG